MNFLMKTSLRLAYSLSAYISPPLASTHRYKDTHVRLISDSKLPLGVHVGVHCLLDRLPQLQLTSSYM